MTDENSVVKSWNETRLANSRISGENDFKCPIGRPGRLQLVEQVVIMVVAGPDSNRLESIIRGHRRRLQFVT